MARGDRVRIGASGAFTEQEQEFTFVYKPRMDPDNPQNLLLAGDQTVLVESQGGVKTGSTGTIHGEPLVTHVSELKENNGVPSVGTNDTILIFPIFLDHYQQVGWFPVYSFKLVSGGVVSNPI